MYQTSTTQKSCIIRSLSVPINSDVVLQSKGNIRFGSSIFLVMMVVIQLRSKILFCS
jgi:hypothetical protein